MYLCTYIYIWIRIHECMCVYIYVCLYAGMHVWMHVYIYIYIYTYSARTHTHTQTHNAQIHVCVSIYLSIDLSVLYKYMYIQPCVCTYVHTYRRTGKRSSLCSSHIRASKNMEQTHTCKCVWCEQVCVHWHIRWRFWTYGVLKADIAYYLCCMLSKRDPFFPPPLPGRSSLLYARFKQHLIYTTCMVPGCWPPSTIFLKLHLIT